MELIKDIVSTLITLIVIRLFRHIVKITEYETYEWFINIFGIVYGIIGSYVINPIIMNKIKNTNIYHDKFLQIIKSVNNIILKTFISKIFFSLIVNKNYFTSSNLMDIYIGISIFILYTVIIKPIIYKKIKNNTDIISDIVESTIIMLSTDYVTDNKLNTNIYEVLIIIFSTILTKIVKYLL